MNHAWDLKLAVIVVLALAIAYLGHVDLGRYISRGSPPSAASCLWSSAVSAWGCGESLTLTGNGG